MINNRQAGRRRGRGGGGNNGGQRQGGGNSGRTDNGNRIDNRARGNAAQLLEKYKNLAADAQRQGDRVNTEYYLQFADHYFRVLSETRSRFEEQNQRRQREENFEEFEADGAEDYGDEGEPIRAGEQQFANDGRGNERREPRDRDGQRDNQRDGGGRDDQREGYARGDNNRGEGRRERAPRAPRRDVRAEGGEPMAAPSIEPANDRAEPAVEAHGADGEPRRRTRVRRERPADDAAPVARDADRLPPSLGIGAAAEPEAEEKPRRRRTRATAAEATQAG